MPTIPVGDQRAADRKAQRARQQAERMGCQPGERWNPNTNACEDLSATPFGQWAGIHRPDLLRLDLLDQGDLTDTMVGQFDGDDDYEDEDIVEDVDVVEDIVDPEEGIEEGVEEEFVEEVPTFFSDPVPTVGNFIQRNFGLLAVATGAIGFLAYRRWWT